MEPGPVPFVMDISLVPKDNKLMPSGLHHKLAPIALGPPVVNFSEDENSKRECRRREAMWLATARAVVVRIAFRDAIVPG